MNIQRAKTEIKNAAAAYLEKDDFGAYRIPTVRQRPILLIGPPGIGKTQIMEQIADEMDLALASYTITHHTRQSAIGLPFIKEKIYDGQPRSVTEYTMSEIIASMYDMMESSGKKEGILFIDEINCVSETLAPAMLQFLQGKSFGNQKVPKGWIIVAAGNPPEYNRSVREFDVVTLDRVKVINVEPDYGVWKGYAYGAGLHGAILSYLDIHKENFYRMETTVDGKQFVTARGWEDLSEMLYAYERLGLKADRDLVMQYLQHPKTARDFASYLELYEKYKQDYRIDEILSGTIRPGTLNKLKFAAFDEHLEVVGLLCARMSENFARTRQMDERTAALFEITKGVAGKLQTGETEGHTPAQLLQAETDRLRAEEERRRSAGQNEKVLRSRYAPLEHILEQMTAQLADYAGREEEAADKLRELFLEKRSELEEQEKLSEQQLEYAFDFMEAAFGESQEMVVFITELSANGDSVWFLREHPCDRYFMYNKRMLFESRDAAIRQQLDDIRNRQIRQKFNEND